MKRSRVGKAAILVLGASFSGLACAAPEMGPMDFPYAEQIPCAVPAQPVTREVRVINDTGGDIPMLGGHRLIVPARSLPVDTAIFRYVVPPSNHVRLIITARRLPADGGGAIQSFSDWLSLTMSYGGRQCTMADGSTIDPDELDIYRINPPEPDPLPKIAVGGDSITTRINSLSTFAIAH